MAEMRSAPENHRSTEPLHRVEDIAQFVADAADVALTPVLPVDSLAEVMRKDPYVLGYVVARLAALAAYGCAGGLSNAKFLDVMERGAQLYLRGHYESMCHLVGTLDPGARGDYLTGAADAQRHCDYLFAQRDTCEHPNYLEALAREKIRAEAMQRRSGSAEAIAHELEYFTLRAYLLSHHPTYLGCGSTRE